MTTIEKIQKLIETKLANHKKEIEEVTIAIIEKGYIYALEWNIIENAAYAEHMIRILSKWETAVSNFTTKFEKFLPHVNYWITNIQDQLCGDPTFCLGVTEGPWMSRSTSVGQNRSSLLKANALREEYQFLHEVKQLLEKEDVESSDKSN